MPIYYGRNGRRYDLGAKLGSGGEGTVYRINGSDDIVAKLYNQEQLREPGARDRMREKIDAMLAAKLSPYVNGVLTIAWPVDRLTDSTGLFQGFVMPMVKDKKSILWACRVDERKILFENKYRWSISVAIAHNLAIAVENVNQAGIVVGDMNPNNILVDKQGYVTLIDADSFSITSDSGKVFKCSVGMEEVLPAELQGKDLSKPGNDFTVYSDRFALAVHIFNLLCDNFHPFGCLDMNSPRSSATTNPRVHNITRGFCPYVKGGRGKTPTGAPDMSILPDDIRELFDRVFKYDARTAVKRETLKARPSATEWRTALYNLYQVRESVSNNRRASTPPKQGFWERIVKMMKDLFK